MELREIAEALGGDSTGSGLRLRKGVISALGTGVASVKIGGDTTAIPDVPVLNSYTPVVNDVVTVLQNGPALLIVGKVGAPAAAPSHPHPYADTVHAHDYAATGHAHSSATQDAIMRAQASLTGGGIILIDSPTHIKWTSRFIPISVGRGSHFSTNGHYDLTCPAPGTTIPGFGGAANRNVTNPSGYVPLGAWEALWAIPTIGGDNTQVSYAATSYTSDFVVPSHWIFIAVRNGDDGRVRMGNGQVYDYWRNVSIFANSWVSWGGADVPQYQKLSNGMVILRGIIKNGTPTPSNAINLPAGYRPGRYQRFTTTPNNAATDPFRIDVAADGWFLFSKGSNAEVSLDSITFLAEL